MYISYGGCVYFVPIAHVLLASWQGYLVQVVEQGDNLTAVKEGEKSLLPPETCERYEECERLQEECVDVADRWQKMKDRLEQNLHLLDQKVCYCSSTIPCTHAMILKLNFITENMTSWSCCHGHKE